MPKYVTQFCVTIGHTGRYRAYYDAKDQRREAIGTAWSVAGVACHGRINKAAIDVIRMEDVRAQQPPRSASYPHPLRSLLPFSPWVALFLRSCCSSSRCLRRNSRRMRSWVLEDDRKKTWNIIEIWDLTSAPFVFRPSLAPQPTQRIPTNRRPTSGQCVIMLAVARLTVGFSRKRSLLSRVHSSIHCAGVCLCGLRLHVDLVCVLVCVFVCFCVDDCTEMEVRQSNSPNPRCHDAAPWNLLMRFA